MFKILIGWKYEFCFKLQSQIIQLCVLVLLHITFVINLTDLIYAYQSGLTFYFHLPTNYTLILNLKLS